MTDVAKRLASLSPAQRALLESRLKKKPQLSQPIAIVGMSCRLPGAKSVEEFWDLVSEGRCAFAEVPENRWDGEAFYDPDPETPGKMATKWGAWVDDVDQFDAMFFGIAPREAIKMDPQQRMLLEVAWETFEKAGYAPDQMAGSSTGVFVGIGGTDYSKLAATFDNYHEYLDAHVGTGNALSIASNRVSYIMDLRGPSLSVDTACSSGLVGLHLAVQALRAGDCDSALAGAVNLVMVPDVTLAFSKARMLSPTGHCRPFDADADGYVRGEGCALLMLKRLTDATRDGDEILAVIKGSAVNQDGRTSGITAPNALSQQACIRAAHRDAGVEAGDIGYIEAHGTGTPLGDPIEFQSLSKLFPKRGENGKPVYVTSAKANIGHTETVSGIAGLMKVVMAMRHGEIPGQALLGDLNPNINLDGTRLQIPREAVSWNGGARRLAGVSSFGFGGTNTHVIVEAADTSSPEASTDSTEEADIGSTERSKHVLAISAKTKPVLPMVAARYRDRLESLSDEDLADFCFSANTGRAHFNQRATLVAQSREQMLEQLAALADDGRAKGMKKGEVKIATKPKVAFLFTGQGAQYAGMGKELYETQPLFREILDECDQILKPLRERSLLDVMFADRKDGAINETQYTQPALFALEYALARLWQSWGVEPSMLLGHSVGEYVAACIGGVFDLPTGLKLIAKRAELMQKMPANGSMAVIFTSRDRVAEAIKSYGDRIAVATANGPENNVISGETALVDEVVAVFEKEGIGTQKLTVSHAFHSPLMDPMLDEFEQFAATLTYERPRIPIVANRTGKLVETADFDAAYWRDHLRNCVEFDAGMQCLDEQGIHAYVEMGPTAALLGMGRRCLPDSSANWIPAMRKGRDTWDTLLNAVAELYLLGVNFDWKGFDAAQQRSKLSLPTYPFQRSRFWMDEETGAVLFGGGARGPAVHPLLGSPLNTALPSTIYEGRFSVDSPKYLKDHQVQGSVVVPGAAYIEQGFASARECFGEGRHAVENIAIQQGMFLPVEGMRIVQVTIGAESGGRASFETLSTSSDTVYASPSWTLHLTGSIVHEESLPKARTHVTLDRDEFKSRVIKSETQESFYQVMHDRALVYGDAFTVLGAIDRTESEAVSEVVIPESIKNDLDKYILHPSIGDAMMQMTSGVIPLEEDGSHAPYTYVPMRIQRVRVHGKITEGLIAYSVRTSEHATTSPEIVECNVYLLSSSGEVVVEAEGVTIQRVGKAIGGAAVQNAADWLFDIEWKPEPIEPAADAALGACLVIAGDSGDAQAVRAKITAAGGDCVVAVLGEEFATLDSGMTLRAAESDDFAAAMKALVAVGKSPLHIINATALSFSAEPAENQNSLAPTLRSIQQAARELGAKQPSTWIVSRGAQTVAGDSQPCSPSQAAVWGMGRVAAVEHPELNVRLVDLDPGNSIEAGLAALVTEIGVGADENQIAYRGDKRLVARLSATPERMSGGGSSDGMALPEEGAYRLRISSAGSFDALYYEPTTPPAPAPGQIAIEVKATGLNFSDVLKAMGLYPGITDAIVPLGIECSGVVTALGEGATGFEVGDEVMGVAPYSFASHAVTADYAMVKKPASLDFAEAATVPITFLTAYYGLIRLAQLEKGERVLIHAGAGGVGLAAIQICKQVGAEIFATAGSDEKREYLKSLGVDHVMNSRTLDFADEIMEITGREGVDVVLNSLPGDAIEKSLSCLRAYGRFLEIGKTDIYSNSKIGLLPFQDNLSYFAIDLDRMLRQKGDYIRKLYAEVMPYFADGLYEALPFTQFSTQETVESFRYMAQRKNIGKVVIAMESASVAAVAEEAPDVIRKDATYLITGGLGALGRRVAEWMHEQGAGHLALLSRRSPSEEVEAEVAKLESAGTRVACIQGDVGDLDSLNSALGQIPEDFGPLAGVIHAAGVLADGVMFDMDIDQLQKPLASKVVGTWNLHQATIDHSLDFFVMFSSVAAVLGSPGQSNYAAGNAYLDAMAEHRKAKGLPALSINWGPWAESGMAAEAGRDENVSGRGMTLLPADKALEVMGELLKSAPAHTAVMSVNWADLLRNAGGKVPALLRDVAADVELTAASDSAEDKAFRESLLTMAIDARRAALVEFFNGQLSKIMGMDPEDIDIVQPLNAMGLDSLMAIELKNKIERRLQTTLPMSAFLHDPSVSSLAEYLAENYGKEPGEDEEAAPAKPSESRVAASTRGHGGKTARIDAAGEPTAKGPTSVTTQAAE